MEENDDKRMFQHHHVAFQRQHARHNGGRTQERHRDAIGPGNACGGESFRGEAG